MTGSQNLVPVLDLGNQYLTGVFPRDPKEGITQGPLELVVAPDGGLLQLRHSYDLSEMYGLNYGYRSGLNRSMVAHLQQTVHRVLKLVTLGPGDVVVDIGSNDGTLLRAYPDYGQRLIGIDPTGVKFRSFYPEHVALLAEFFSADAFRGVAPGKKAKVVTSISMFYDLEHPLGFMQEVEEILADDGVWHMEQSYMPSMLRAKAYDTVCHEHLEYYALAQIKWMADRANLKILDVELNDVNGGSFAVTLSRRDAPFSEAERLVDGLIRAEDEMGLATLKPYDEFREAVFAHRDRLVRVVRELRAAGKRVLGYGASTKGNVLLQFCGFTPDDLPFIAEVNPDKFGCYTPGTNIPIISEADARRMAPDYYLVLPWHFRPNLIERERQFLASGGTMIFPLPDISLVGPSQPQVEDVLAMR